MLSCSHVLRYSSLFTVPVMWYLLLHVYPKSFWILVVCWYTSLTVQKLCSYSFQKDAIASQEVNFGNSEQNADQSIKFWFCLTKLFRQGNGRLLWIALMRSTTIKYIHYFKKKIKGGRMKCIIHVLILYQASFLGSKLFSREIGASTILFEVFWFCCIMGINTQINRKQFVMNDVFFKMKLFLKFSWLHAKWHLTVHIFCLHCELECFYYLIRDLIFFLPKYVFAEYIVET